MILAIDQGGSKTHALVGDEQGHILGTGLAEGACHFLVGMETAMRAANAAACNAMIQAGVSREEITIVSAGMSGANWPEEFRQLTEELEKLFPRARVKVYNDIIPALYAGTQSPDAVILCAGTAFNAAVLKDRKIVWIYNNYTEFIDEGGRSLGTKAMEGVFRSETGMGPETSLKERALEFFGYEEILPMLLDFSRNCLKRPLKDFATAVDEEAMKGDQVALNVQYEFGKSLSRYAVAALKKYEMKSRTVDIVLSGGLFKARSPVLTDVIRTEVHLISPLARIVDARYEPVLGAYDLALDQSRKQEWWPLLQEAARRLFLERI